MLFGCSNSNGPSNENSDGQEMPSEDGSSSEITSNSYVDVLEHSLELLRGQFYQRLMITLKSGEDAWGAPSSQPSGNILNGSCTLGGSFSRTENYTPNDAGQVPTNSIELTLTECALNDVQISGLVTIDLETESSRQGTTVTQEITLNNLAVDSVNYSESINAVLTQTAATFGFQQSYNIDFQTSDYVRTSSEDRLKLSSANYIQNFNHEQDTQGATTEHSFSESGSAVLQLSGSLDLRASLNMFPALEYANQSIEETTDWTHTGNLASGNLEIASIDGSTIQVTADTGNVETVNYVISSDGFQTLVEDFWFAPAASSQLP